MAYLNFPSGFNIGSKDAIDSRLIKTAEELKTLTPELHPELFYTMPDVYLCLCSDDGRIYIFDSTITPSAETGYFKPAEDFNKYDSEQAKKNIEDALQGRIKMDGGVIGGNE